MEWWVMSCLTCWWGPQEGNDSGISCRWLLVSACSTLAGTILVLFAWAKTKDARIEELHKEKDIIQDARLNDFKERYDKLSHRKSASASDT